ncbi:MAG: NAD(+)/NADH kinase [Mariprofundaceae bacterium]|nr:NAD(+)/NADH kinase [Mariprofundaceae bacterium]
MRCMGMVVKQGDARALTLADEVATWLSECGCEVYVADQPAVLHHAQTMPMAEMLHCVEMMLVLGGDGTLLGVGRHFIGTSIPILGINMGRVGFLTDTPAGSVLQALAKVLSGQFKTIEHISLKAEIVRDHEVLDVGFAMNDVVLQRVGSRPVEFDVRIRNQQAFRLRADGLILATAAGSTAYALSSGGPIIHPAVAAIAVVPICPHTLSNRPLIISADDAIEVRLCSQPEPANLHLDGEPMQQLTASDVVRIRQSGKITLVYMKDHHYFNTLRNKLHWADGASRVAEDSC